MTDRRPATNPFLERNAAGEVALQLKLSLVLYLDYAPGPKRARVVYDAYLARFAQRLAVHQSTSWMGPPLPWDDAARYRFEQRELPELRQHGDWGHAFSDGKAIDGSLFMFHGYRPVTEAGRAGFFRFEWPWDEDPEGVFAFAAEVADAIPFLSGSAGYILSANPFDDQAYDRMFALAWRYWGLEAWNLDVTVNHTRAGYKCPSWITLIGARLLERSTGTVNLEAIAAYATARKHGVLYLGRPRPAFIDRNRAEACAAERAIALALLPLQIEEHAPLGGTRWTEENTVEWLRRFSSAGEE